MERIIMKKQQSGFTLIELMIVVAIIGILAAIAVPQYQNFMARSQAAESVVLLDGARTAIEDVVVDTGDFVANRAALTALSVNLTGTYGSITGTVPTSAAGTATSDGGVVVYKTAATGINKNIQGKTIQLTRTSSTGAWACSTDLTAKFAPKKCTPGATAVTGL